MDPIVALRPCAIDVEVGEYEYTIPALPALPWLEAVLDTDGAAIIPGLLSSADQRDIMDDYVSGAVTPEDLLRAARNALGAAAGRPYWEADRLIRGAAHQDAWAVVSGELVTSGVDLERISIAAYCNAVYAYAVRNASKEDRERLDLELKMIPADVNIEDVYDEDEETANFMADLAEFGQAEGAPED